MPTYSSFQNAALLILRIIIAAIFYVSAYSKIPYWSSNPEGTGAFLLLSTKILSIAEPLGATAVLFGFLTRWASFGLIIILLAAIYISKTVYGIGFITPTSPGWDFPLMVLGGCVILLAFGPGNWSIDYNRGRK